jgi:hypothetical protein
LRRLPQKLACPIFARASAETHPISLLAGEGSRPIQTFGAISATCEAGMVMNEEIDEEAKEIHEDYCKENRDKPGSDQDPAMQPWDYLDEGYRESNRANAEHLDIKLRAAGCKTRKLEPDAKAAAFRFSDKEIERLAKMEHARWNAERFLAGWKLGKERDKDKKTSPYLVAWDELPEDIKDYDRNIVRELPKMLARLKPKREIVREVAP